MKLIAACADSTGATGTNALENTPGTMLAVANTEDPRTLALEGVVRIDLHFPKFTDGRAFSQAFLLRRRLGFKGEIRATGDVLIDQLVQMERTGFDVAVLRQDQNLASAQVQLARYRDFYQGDAVTAQPLFVREPAAVPAAAPAAEFSDAGAYV